MRLSSIRIFWTGDRSGVYMRELAAGCQLCHRPGVLHQPRTHGSVGKAGLVSVALSSRLNIENRTKISVISI